MNLTREQERQVEVFFAMAPYASVDFEDVVFQLRLKRSAERKAEYRDLQLFDPRSYRDLLAASAADRRARRAVVEGYKPNLTKREAREAREMFRLGAPSKVIASAFRVTTRGLQRVLAGQSHADAGGYTHPKQTRKRGERVRVVRGAAHPRATLTRELVDRVLAMSGSHRAIGRAVGLHHSHVGEIKAGRSWVQRQGDV